jgi:hypothetical protein
MISNGPIFTACLVISPPPPGHLRAWPPLLSPENKITAVVKPNKKGRAVRPFLEILIYRKILTALNIGIAGTSALSWDSRKIYPIYSALHRVPEGIKRKDFEQGKAEQPDMNGSSWHCTR